jgi:hypothetical protein
MAYKRFAGCTTPGRTPEYYEEMWRNRSIALKAYSNCEISQYMARHPLGSGITVRFVNETISLCGRNSDEFGHWNNDVMPFFGLLDAKFLRRLHIVLPADSRPFRREMMGWFVASDRLIELKWNEVVNARVAYSLNMPIWRSCLPGVHRRYRERVWTFLGLSRNQAHLHVLWNREKWESRHINNWGDVHRAFLREMPNIAWIAEEGGALRNLSMTATARYFHDVKVMVAAESSACIRLMYVQDRGVYVEIQSRKSLHFWWNASRALGLYFIAVRMPKMPHKIWSDRNSMPPGMMEDAANATREFLEADAAGPVYAS